MVASVSLIPAGCSLTIDQTLQIAWFNYGKKLIGGDVFVRFRKTDDWHSVKSAKAVKGQSLSAV